MATERQHPLALAKRVVVKVGSNVLTQDSGLNLAVIRSISRQISRLMYKGREIILVSSGAMAAGMRKLALPARPTEIPARQGVAAVGQAGLILAYEKAFARHGRKVAQILLTAEDMTHRKRYLNARNTLNTLLAWGVVPVINENDTVMVEEIQFGDNDNLAAVIALLMDAQALINLSDIEGLFDKDPRTEPDARLIPEVVSIGRTIESVALGIPGSLGTGGMLSKIRAARKTTAAGIPMVIASGRQRDILLRLFAGESRGTLFVPRSQRLPSRKCWIAFSLKPKGTLRVDGGAEKALIQGGKSLLPSGILGVEGEFGSGDPVQFVNAAGEILGNGLVNYNASDIRKIKGLQTNRITAVLGEKPFDEVVHRDNLVLFAETD
jgi:glutamate 5-kinase